MPSSWMRATDPIAIATNSDTKVSEEVKKDIEWTTKSHLIKHIFVFTFFTFYVVGFDFK